MSHENYQNQTCISSGFLVNLLLGGVRAENTVKNISGISFSPHTARITTPRGPSFSQLGDFVEVSEMLVDIFISRVEHECFCIQLFNYAVFYQIINQVFCKSKISYKNRFLPRKKYKLDLHYWQILCCLWAWCAPQPAFGFYCLLVSSRRIFVLSLWKKNLARFFTHLEMFEGRAAGGDWPYQGGGDQSEGGIRMTHHETKAWRKKSVEISNFQKSEILTHFFVLGLISWEFTGAFPSLASLPLQFTLWRVF